MGRDPASDNQTKQPFFLQNGDGFDALNTLHRLVWSKSYRTCVEEFGCFVDEHENGLKTTVVMEY